MRRYGKFEIYWGRIPPNEARKNEPQDTSDGRGHMFVIVSADDVLKTGAVQAIPGTSNRPPLDDRFWVQVATAEITTVPTDNPPSGHLTFFKCWQCRVLDVSRLGNRAGAIKDEEVQSRFAEALNEVFGL